MKTQTLPVPANPILSSGVYHSYIVRLWQTDPEASWRASALCVQTGELIRFADLHSLFAFLYAQTITGESGHEEPPTPTR